MRFHVEWTNGHGRSTHYFALLRAEDEPLLGALTEADLEQYLAEAPEGATRYEGAAWRKRHYGWTDRQAAGGAGSHDEFTAEGKVAIAAGDADHVERPAALASAGNASAGATMARASLRTTCSCTAIRKRRMHPTCASRTPRQATRTCSPCTASSRRTRKPRHNPPARPRPSAPTARLRATAI